MALLTLDCARHMPVVVALDGAASHPVHDTRYKCICISSQVTEQQRAIRAKEWYARGVSALQRQRARLAAGMDVANIVEGGRGGRRGAAARPAVNYAAMTRRGSDSDDSAPSDADSAEARPAPATV